MGRGGGWLAAAEGRKKERKNHTGSMKSFYYKNKRGKHNT